MAAKYNALKYAKIVKDVDDCSSGVSFSEPLLFYTACLIFDIKVIIESGTCRGQSAEIWAKLFPNTPIYTIDNLSAPSSMEINKQAREKLKKYGNVTTILGDANTVIDGILNKNAHIKTAVFFDGPKEKPALKLANQLFEKHQSVTFIAIDDFGVKKPSSTRNALLNYESKNMEMVYNTGDDGGWYKETFQWIDEKCGYGIGRGGLHGIAFFLRKTVI